MATADALTRPPHLGGRRAARAERDRRDEHGAGEHVLPVGRDGQQVEGVRQDREQHGADHGAERGAAPAPQRGAADDDGRDDVHLEAHRHVALGGREPAGHEDPGEREAHAGDDEHADLHAVHGQAGELGGPLVRAHGAQRAPEVRPLQHQVGDEREQHEHQERHGQPAERARGGGAVVAGRDRHDGPGRPDEREAQEQVQRAEGGDERRDPRVRHEQPVDEAEDGADDQREPDRGADRGVRQHGRHRDGRDRDDAADGQVEQARGDQERHAAGREPDERRLEQDVREVAGPPERRPGGADADAQHGEHDDEVVLREEPAHGRAEGRTRALPAGRAAAGSARRGGAGRGVGRGHESLPSSIRRTAARCAPSMLSAKTSRPPSATYW
nr:hypothetical protein [Cellulomonas sp. JZ18]